MKEIWCWGIGVTALLLSACSPKNTVPQLGKESVTDVINEMTLDEKLDIIRGAGMPTANGDAPVVGHVAGKVPGAAGNTNPIPRLGIPALSLADGPAGLRIDSEREKDSKRYYATAFPTGTSLASTWNTVLVEQVGQAMGNEVHEYGVDILLAPGMNIQRNPLGGRNFEYYSEDPLLTGELASAMVKGVQSNGVGTSIKHFAVNDQETGRFRIDAVVSPRAAREIYLKPFEIAIRESDPWTVMSAYNKINGTYASENYDLLTTILRDEWGYEGMVVTDWLAGRDYAGQVKAGNDLLMPGRVNEKTQIQEALTEGRLTEAELDRNIERILNLVTKSPTFKGYKYSDKPDLKAHAALAREAAAEGMILLKNESESLPLRAKKLALLGNTSYKLIEGGKGSGQVNNAYTISLLQGMEEAGYLINPDLQKKYQDYIASASTGDDGEQSFAAVKPLDEIQFNQSELEELANENGAAIITIGRQVGEGNDRDIETDYYLVSEELSLIKHTAEAFHAKGKPVVVVLNIGAAVDVASWRDDVDGIIVAWQPGQEAGYAIADVISGKVNPSGRLTSTLPLRYEDVPSASHFPGTPARRPKETIYNEGIYVGYRYYNTFNKPVAYEFGYGLSYTTFQLSGLEISSETFDDELTVTLDVTNTGELAGKEVVQLYLVAPAETMDKPSEELKEFKKTKLLKPGKTQKISFTISASDLASFNTDRSAWVADPGIYTLKIGTSSRKFESSKTFTLENEIVTEKVHQVLMPQETITELTLKR